MPVEHQTKDPANAQPRPPYPPQTQPNPGRESQMNPRPDYGEHSYKGANRLTGKKALITGGDSGIGRAVALAFAREGADVLISYLNEGYLEILTHIMALVIARPPKQYCLLEPNE